jgi:hypothetical protein
MAPDFTVGCIEYAKDIVARVTCSVVAPRDKSLTIVGDEGVLSVENLRNDTAPVYISPGDGRRLRGTVASRIQSLLNRLPWLGCQWSDKRKYPIAGKPSGGTVGADKPVDFCRGPAELMAAVKENRPCRLSADLGLHITELIETLQYPERFGGRRCITSTFSPIAPLVWSN